MDYLAGCVGGACGVIVGHPLDTIKVRLQLQSSTQLQYKGTVDCFLKIVQKEKVRGLFKGITSPLLGVAGVNALVFGVYGSLRPYVHGEPGYNALWAHFGAGALSGAVQSFIASPMELVKTRMQLNGITTTASSNSSKPPSALAVLTSAVQNKSIFKGWGITLCREIPGFGSYFAAYELLTSRGSEASTFTMMMAGGAAGVISWLFTFPIDVVKTRLQADLKGEYQGAIDCFKKTWKAEGTKAFTRGLNSTLLRAFPTNAATFTVVTWIMRLTDKQSSEDKRKEHIEELMKESDNIRRKFEGALRIPLPHYYIFSTATGLMSESSPFFAKAIIAEQGKIIQKHFNFHHWAHHEEGLIRERFTEAFRVEREKERAVTQLQMSALASNMFPGCDDEAFQTLKVKNQATSDPEANHNNVSEAAPGVLMEIKKCLMMTISASQLRSVIFNFFGETLFRMRLCNCWDDICFCCH